MRAGRGDETTSRERGTAFGKTCTMRPVRGDEQHVERQPGVRHPHGGPLALGEQEQHAGIGRQRAAEHEAPRPLLRRLRKLDLEEARARPRLDPHFAAPERDVPGEGRRRRHQQRRQQPQHAEPVSLPHGAASFPRRHFYTAAPARPAMPVDIFLPRGCNSGK